MGYQAFWNNDQGIALRFIQTAQRAVAGLPPTRLHALLAARAARAYAGLGDRERCWSAYDDASRALEDASDGPEWTAWVSPGIIEADAGRAALELRDYASAAHRLERGLEMMGDDQPRNRLLHQCSLSLARLGLHDVEGASEAARDAARLGGLIVSARGAARLGDVMTIHERLGTPAARTIAIEIRQALDSAPVRS